VGGVLGAEVLLETRQRTFMHLIPWLILGGTLIFGVSGPLGKWMRSRSRHAHLEPHAEPKISPLPLGLALLPVSLYIGYIGAGGGVLVMTILALFGMEHMHALNAMKVVAATLSNLCAIFTFIFSGAVIWHDCLLAMVFAAAGGYLGARLAKRANGEVLRAVVVVTGCVIASYFFWERAHGGA